MPRSSSRKNTRAPRKGAKYGSWVEVWLFFLIAFGVYLIAALLGLSWAGQSGRQAGEHLRMFWGSAVLVPMLFWLYLCLAWSVRYRVPRLLNQILGTAQLYLSFALLFGLMRQVGWGGSWTLFEPGDVGNALARFFMLNLGLLGSLIANAASFIFAAYLFQSRTSFALRSILHRNTQDLDATNVAPRRKRPVSKGNSSRRSTSGRSQSSRTTASSPTFRTDTNSSTPPSTRVFSRSSSSSSSSASNFTTTTPNNPTPSRNLTGRMTSPSTRVFSRSKSSSEPDSTEMFSSTRSGTFTASTSARVVPPVPNFRSGTTESATRVFPRSSSSSPSSSPTSPTHSSRRSSSFNFEPQDSRLIPPTPPRRRAPAPATTETTPPDTVTFTPMSARPSFTVPSSPRSSSIFDVPTSSPRTQTSPNTAFPQEYSTSEPVTFSESPSVNVNSNTEDNSMSHQPGWRTAWMFQTPSSTSSKIRTPNRTGSGIHSSRTSNSELRTPDFLRSKRDNPELDSRWPSRLSSSDMSNVEPVVVTSRPSTGRTSTSSNVATPMPTSTSMSAPTSTTATRSISRSQTVFVPSLANATLSSMPVKTVQSVSCPDAHGKNVVKSVSDNELLHPVENVKLFETDVSTSYKELMGKFHLPTESQIQPVSVESSERETSSAFLKSQTELSTLLTNDDTHRPKASQSLSPTATVSTAEPVVTPTPLTFKTQNSSLHGGAKQLQTDTPLANAVTSPVIAPKISAPEPQPKRSLEGRFPPPLDLFGPVASNEGDQEALAIAEKQGKVIVEALANFSVNASVAHIVIGPSIIQFQLELAPGTKVNKVSGLTNDLTMALAVTSVRVEAPILGQPYVGIEIPNPRRRAVPLREALGTKEFQESNAVLPMPMGMLVDSKFLVCGLEEMPHVLVAGTTGSGKSVFVNACILGMCSRRTPEELRLILVDPKRVEFTIYEGLPHLLSQPISEPSRAIDALNWAVQEMENRMEKFAQMRARNLASYNKKVSPKERCPSIVIVIDELADLMYTAGKDVESLIVRLAQKARAAGIYLILATQRPSVDVITGLIKANIPARVAFAVPSQTDSRTILDGGGADKLLGRGDMLFTSPDHQTPRRLQSPFVTEECTQDFVDYMKELFGEPNYVDFPDASLANFSILGSNGKNGDKDGVDILFDPKLDEALELVLLSGVTTSNGLQRYLGIAYPKASRIIMTLEQLGILGPQISTNPREVLMGHEAALDSLESARASRAADQVGDE